MEKINPSSKTVLCITGATGFVGRATVKRLLQSDQYAIRALTRKRGPNHHLPKQVKLFQGDLLLKNSLQPFLDSASILINLAYCKDSTREQNIQGTNNLIKAARETNLQKIVHCSTAVVAGRSRANVVNEETVCLPHTDYEQTKSEIEKCFVRNSRNAYQLAILRPTVIFGKGGTNLIKILDDYKYDSQLIKYLRQLIYSDRYINLVSINSVVDALIFLVSKETHDESPIFIISDDEYSTNNYRSLINSIENKPNRRPNNVLENISSTCLLPLLLLISGRSNTKRKTTYSWDKLRSAGFVKSSNFDQQIKMYCEWYMRTKISKEK